MAKAQFPRDFLFGSATAAYQVEGGVKEDGRGESIWDRFCHTPGKIKGGHTGDISCDHYHRVDEDVALMKELGLEAYRFSIAWPRVVPDGEGAVNEKGLDWYSRLADKLLAVGIKPVATLYHWDLPQALEDRHGGWRGRATVEAFGRYADAVVARLGDRVKTWVPLNEMPATVVAGYQAGFHAPGAKEPRKVCLEIQHNLLLAHGQGVRAVRQHGGPGAEVGTAHNARVFVPVYETAEHIDAAAKAFLHYNAPMLDPMAKGSYPERWLSAMGADAPRSRAGDMELISGSLDFFGLNVYRGTFVRSAASASAAKVTGALGGVENVGIPSNQATPTLAVEPTLEDGFDAIPFPPNYPKCCAGWVMIVPQCIYWGLKHLHELYGYKKLYVTENGAAMDDQVVGGEVLDIDREQFYREYLRSAARALAERIPLKGYFAWSLMDNFEWSQGYSERFGIVRVDYQTLQRTPKLSARFYAECIRARRVV
jgi:beta-glucosidase